MSGKRVVGSSFEVQYGSLRKKDSSESVNMMRYSVFRRLGLLLPAPVESGAD